MKEYLRKKLNTSLFNSVRSAYRGIRSVYRKVSPWIYVNDSFNTYTQADRRMSTLPLKINYVKPTPLCEIMKRHGTDKAMYQQPGHHNYTLFYDAAFRQFKGRPVRLFEMGIGTINPAITHNMGVNGRPGASLRGWQEYFPLAQVYAADIDSEILFEKDRIKTYYADQLNGEVIQKMWATNQELQDEFNIIIDDGLHTFEANRCFFENSVHKLKTGGFYVIEDVLMSTLKDWEQMIKSQYATKYSDLKFTFLNLPNDFNVGENALVIVEKLPARAVT